MTRPSFLLVAGVLLPVALLGGCKTECAEGYRAQAGECVDIDECTATSAPDRHECGPNATCTNLPGGYSCAFTQDDAPPEPAR